MLYFGPGFGGQAQLRLPHSCAVTGDPASGAVLSVDKGCETASF